MSSLFELQDRVRRLRQMAGYFKSAAVLTGSELRNAVVPEEHAREEWLALVSEVRDCLAVMETVTSRAEEMNSTSQMSWASTMVH